MLVRSVKWFLCVLSVMIFIIEPRPCIPAPPTSTVGLSPDAQNSFRHGSFTFCSAVRHLWPVAGCALQEDGQL